MYLRVSPVDILNIITALLYLSCFINERSLRVFSLSSVGIDRSEKKKKKMLRACVAIIYLCIIIILVGLHNRFIFHVK